MAVISNNPNLGEDEANEAKTDWLAKYAGPNRVPAILPAGTQVIPLAWSPDDAQLTEARRMALLDVANIFNLDGYYLGAPNATLTYQSPGANFSNLLRLSLEPVLADFEDAWSMAWLPRGHRLALRPPAADPRRLRRHHRDPRYGRRCRNLDRG